MDFITLACIFSFIVFGDAQILGYYWVVTDFHYDDSYTSTRDGCKSPILSELGPYGNNDCDAPRLLVEDSINTMARIKPDVDFILWTGDSSAHYPKHLMTFDRNMAALKVITEKLSTAFPHVTCIPCLGNHDFYPSDSTNGSEVDVYYRICTLWASWIGEMEEIQRCKHGGYFSVLINSKLRVLSLNTVLYMERNPQTTGMVDPAGQFKWLQLVLSAARQKNEKVLVTAHVAPTFLVPPLIEWFQPKFKERYLDLMTSYADVIVAHHYGHSHLDNFKILQREDGTGASPVFQAPSVSPWRYRCPSETYPRNPGIRLVQYDKETSKMLNYWQYYMNLTESNAVGRSNWIELYNFCEAYGVPDMSVTSLRTVIQRMRSAFGEHMTLHCMFLLVSHHQQANRNLKHRAKIWCGSQLTNRSQVEHCVSNYIVEYEKNERTHRFWDFIM